MKPEELAGLLSKSNRPRPTLIYVGYHSLFVGAHIQGAIFAGPDSKPEGIDQLKAVVRNIPRNHAIVVYCGCCPFDHCPNVQPGLPDIEGTRLRARERRPHSDQPSHGLGRERLSDNQGAGY